MSWRTVVISNRCKLDLKMGFLVVRGEETKRVYLDEIAILIIENTAVSLTGCLLSALVEKSVTDVIRKNKPPEGIVQVLSVTEKQFAGIEYITGSSHSDVVDSDERLVIL